MTSDPLISPAHTCIVRAAGELLKELLVMIAADFDREDHRAVPCGTFMRTLEADLKVTCIVEVVVVFGSRPPPLNFPRGVMSHKSQ